MDRIQLISTNQDLVTNLEQRFGALLVHTESVESAALNAAAGNIGTTIIEGYEKLSTLEKIITVLRDASPSMAITCLVKPDNVRKIINSELKPYIYRVLPNNTSLGQIVLAAKSSQQEHKALQARVASGEDLTVEMRHDATLGPFLPTPSRSFWVSIFGSLVCVSLLTAFVIFREPQTSGAANGNVIAKIEVPETTIAGDETVETDTLAPLAESTELTSSPNTTTSNTEQESVEQSPATDIAMLEFVPQPQEDTVSTMLSKARDAMLKDQLVDPYGDNAVTYFKQVLSIEQKNQAALNGLEEIQQRLVGRIEASLRSNDKQLASIDIVTLRSLYPQHPQIAALSTRLLRSELPNQIDANQDNTGGAQNLTTNAPAIGSNNEKLVDEIEEPPSIQDQVNEILRSADDHIEAYRFDSAISVLNSRTAAVSAYDNLFNQRVTRIRNILLRSGNIAITEQDLVSANESIRLLDRLGLSNESESLNQRLAPSPETTKIGLYEPASSIKVTPPTYPKLALKRNIEGFVQLSFIVRANGDIDDIQILDSAPSDIFNDAAIKAIKNSRYQPANRDGIPEDQRVKQKLNFSVAKK